CDRIAVMNHGIIQQVGTPQELYERPANLFVANFLGTANILEGRLVGDGPSRIFEASGGLRIPVRNGEPVHANARAVFRPQDTAIIDQGVAPPDTTPFKGTVSWREFLGASVRYGVRAGTSELVVDRPFHAGDPLHEVGTSVTVAIASGSVRWLAE
ncbi:MAG: TOBE domain-containing protein, partial [Bradyrhizobium sp.]